MNKTIFYLSTCSTCTRIIKELKVDKTFHLRDIKKEKITEEQIDYLANLSGSYSSLFSKKAIKYRTMNLAQKKLIESDYKQLILEEYTFLRRPIVILGKKLFIGNSKETIETAKAEMKK